MDAVRAGADDVVHVFLDLDRTVLDRRIAGSPDRRAGPPPGRPGARRRCPQLPSSHHRSLLAASARMPAGTLHLRSDQRTPEQLADDVITHLEAPTGRTTPLPS